MCVCARAHVRVHAHMCAQLCPAICDPMEYSQPGSSCLWNSPAKNTEVGCYSLLQGVFPTQGRNPHLLHLQDYRRVLYHWATWESLTFLRGQEILHGGGNTCRQTGRRRWSSSRWGQWTVAGKAEAWHVQEEERVWCEFGERFYGSEMCEARKDVRAC